MSEGPAVVRTSQGGGGNFLSKLPMPSGCLEMVSLPLPHVNVSSHSFFRTAQFMTQFVLVHSLLADANILPPYSDAGAEIRRLDLVLLQYGLGNAALVLLATGAMFACGWGSK